MGQGPSTPGAGMGGRRDDPVRGLNSGLDSTGNPAPTNWPVQAMNMGMQPNTPTLGPASLLPAAAVAAMQPNAAPLTGRTSAGQTTVPGPALQSSHPAPAPAAPAGAVPTRPKQTTLIPGWSKALSSQALQLECQRICQPSREPMAARDSYAVLDLEVMKFVAYCGGVTIKFRMEDAQVGGAAAAAPPGQQLITWGLASTRPCTALAANNTPTPTSLASTAPGGTGQGASGASTAATAPTNPAVCTTGTPVGSPIASVPIDSPSRKPLYVICATMSSVQLGAQDILSIDLAPREGGQPVIIATLKLNDEVILQQLLPCSSISMLQMYPFLTLAPGLGASLYEATTPSPLFTWYHSLGNPMPDIVLGDLDTSIKYISSPTSLAHAQAHLGAQADFLGSATFSQGRHRWTVQLDNIGALPTHVYVGVAQCSGSHMLAASNSSVLSNVQGPLRSIANSNSIAAAAAGSSSAAGPSASLFSGGSDAGTSDAVAGRSRTSGNGATSSSVSRSGAAPPMQWGSWIRLPGAAPANGAHALLPPHRDGHVHHAEATTSHCFVTVDLDLTNGYVRFFRNGHLIGTAFTGVTGPVCPVVTLVQGVSVNCSAGLVNITKLRQLDLTWTLESCSADLQLAGPVVSKVSEVYGDYSTVLADQGFTSGVHLWLIKINNLSEPDSIFIGVCRGCMPLDQDPQDLRDRTYYLSNGVIRVGGRRVATNAANFTKGDTVGVVLDADQGEIVFFRNGAEQGRARGIRGRLFPFVSCDSEGDQITMLGSYTLLLDRIPRQLADMEWDTKNHASDIELSSNCLTATKTSSNHPSTVHGTILYKGTGVHEFHVILDTIGPDGVWVGVAPANMPPSSTVGDVDCGWALHSDGDKRSEGREEEYTAAFKSGDVLTVCVDLGKGTLRFSRNGTPLGEAFTGVKGPLVPAATLASEESKITIQNRPTVLNTGEYVGELRWDEARAGKDLNVIDGLTVTKMANEGGDYATVLGTLCLASGQHSWNVYINHVEDSNLFIGVTVGGHDLNADPQEMKHRTYYLSNGTIRVAGKLITRCAEPYAEGDLVAVQLDMEARHVQFLKNGVLQGAGDGLPEEVWPYVSLDNIMDSITLHSSSMFVDLVQSLRWNPTKVCRLVALAADGACAQLRALGGEETYGQGTVLGLREYTKIETHSWVVRLEQGPGTAVSNFLVGVAPPTMDLNKSLGEETCGIGLDYYGYFYVNGKYFHVSNLSNWREVSKPVRGSTAKHKGKAQPIFFFQEGKCEITMTLDLKEKTLKFAHAGRSLGIITDVNGPLHAAVTLTSSRQKASLAPGPIGKSEHTNEELVNILKGKGFALSSRMEAALLLVPRELFVPRDRQREAFRDQKVTVRLSDGSSMTLPPPSFVASALDKLGVGTTARSFLDIGCGTAYVAALAACLLADMPGAMVQGVECVSSRLEAACANMRALKDRLSNNSIPAGCEVLGNPMAALSKVELLLANVLIPECTHGQTYDALFCDVEVSEEELPTLLSLLKPCGKLVCLIEEEAVLITRGSSDPHDFHREVLQQIQGDFGQLDDPTPWEVQEAILRIKDRERKRGHDQAKQDAANLRSFEYVEMQQRVQAAMQRIAELESQVQRVAMMDAQLPNRSPARITPVDIQACRSPSMVSSIAADDVRVAVKDKERRGHSLLKPSPRNSLVQPTSPMPSPGVNDSGDWKAMYTTESAAAAAAAAAAAPMPSRAKARARELLSEPDQSSVFEDQDELMVDLQEEDQEQQDACDLLAGGLPAAMDGPMDSWPAPLSATASMSAPSGQMHLAHQVYENIIDSMSVQTFTPEQIASMISGAEPQQVENRDVFPGTFKGVRVRVWRISVSHNVSYIELKRAYSKYCIAHPNIAAVLGVCIQHASSTTLCHTMSASTPDLRRAASCIPTHPASPSPLSRCTYARSVPDSSWMHPSAAVATAAAVAALSLQDDTGMGVTDNQSVFEDEGDADDAEPLCTGVAARTTSLQWPPSGGVDGHGAAGMPAVMLPGTPVGTPPGGGQQHTLWVVEESFGEESLHCRLERGLLSWQQACRIATDVCKALAFLQDLKRHSAAWDRPDTGVRDVYSPGRDGLRATGALHPDAVLSAYALRSVVTPANVSVDAQSTKVSVLPALLHHLEQVLGEPHAPLPYAPLHCDMAYIDPHSMLSEATTPSFYAFGIVMLQLLTEQGPLGLLSAVKEALDNGTLMNLIPRLPVNAQMTAWAVEFGQLAIRCTQPGVVLALEQELLPELEELAGRLGALGTSAMSWEQVEELLMLPLQPRNNSDSAARRWVRQDFRMRRKLFLEEVAKLASDGPVHKIDVRRGRCFKDSIDKFAGKGHAVWRQPLKVSFLGEQGMDSGGVTREWFSSLSSSISRGSPELFWAAGPQKNQLYINPLSSAPTHLKKFHFIGLFMAKAILESSARAKELGPIVLNLPFCEPLWKLLLGIPLNLMDLQLLDPTEFRSLMSILDMDIDGLIFEMFAWSFHQGSHTPAPPVSAAGFGVGMGYVPPVPTVTLPGAAGPSGTVSTPRGNNSGVNVATSSSSPMPGGENEVGTPTASHAPPLSPMAAPEASDDHQAVSIPLKPGGTHLKVTNQNKREYVLLKAHKMLVGTIEAQMTAIIDAFHSIIPRDLLDKYGFTSLELQLLVCGEQRIDIQDLQRNCKYEDGYTGKEDIITWFWEVVEGFDDAHRRQLLQFWSGSDGMPAEGFAAMDPAFHMVAVERLYDPNDTTARLPAAHTCFRQLDLPRYKSADELRDKLITAITIGQGYMALS